MILNYLSLTLVLVDLKQIYLNFLSRIKIIKKLQSEKLLSQILFENYCESILIEKYFLTFDIAELLICFSTYIRTIKT